jgi:hypothetical protein
MVSDFGYHTPPWFIPRLFINEKRQVKIFFKAHFDF